MKSGIVGSSGPIYKVLPSDKDRSSGSTPKKPDKPAKKKDDNPDQNTIDKNGTKVLIDEYV